MRPVKFSPTSRLRPKAALLLPLIAVGVAVAGPSRLHAGGQPRSSSDKAVATAPPLESARSGSTQVNLQQSSGGIRQQLLEATPRGTSFAATREFLSDKFQRRGTIPLGAVPVRSSTYPVAADSDRLRKRLVIFLGFRHRGIEIATRTAFTAYYAFDDQDHLSDIILVREEEHV